ncbi:hypothetical protein J3F83DRAFT_765843 [Trichoderma novae-zelandiae]
MPSKRKLVSEANIEPASVPSTLPPSVEEAYRRKCVQLKNRTNEVEDANDAARLRLARIKRQVEKLRIERAFLLEQLAKRTSTNVEDSEGSPSPPPTATSFDIPTEPNANPRKPKDKPLRIKKGHRKSNAPADGDGDGDGKPGSTKEPASPASETNSQAKRSRPNGVAKSPQPSKTPFELYCEEARPVLEAKERDDKDEADVNIDEELKRDWEELPEAEREEWQAKADQLSKAQEEQEEEDKAAADEAENNDSPKQGSPKAEADPEADPEADHEAEAEAEPEAEKTEAQDDDVEMSNYDTDDQETQMDKDGDDEKD